MKGLGWIMIGAILVLSTMFVLGFALQAWMLRLMRKRHGDVWEKLGSPTLFFNASIKRDFVIQRYLKRKEYDLLDDQELSSVCRALVILQRIYMLVFFVSLTLFAVNIWAHQ